LESFKKAALLKWEVFAQTLECKRKSKMKEEIQKIKME